jgi:hypothetical protein
LALFFFLSSSLSPGPLLFYQKEGRQGFEILYGLLSDKNIRIPIKKKLWGPPLPPHYDIFGRTRGGILKSCHIVPKLRI